VGVTAAAAVAATVSRRTAGTAGARRAAETGAGTDGAAAAAGILGGADWSCDSIQHGDRWQQLWLEHHTPCEWCRWNWRLQSTGVSHATPCPLPLWWRRQQDRRTCTCNSEAGTDGAAAAARSATGGCCCSSETAAAARSRVGAAAAAAAPRPSVGTSETGGFSSHFRARHAAPWPLLLWWLPLPGYAEADAVATVAAHCCRQASKCTSPVVGSACLFVSSCICQAHPTGLRPVTDKWDCWLLHGLFYVLLCCACSCCNCLAVTGDMSRQCTCHVAVQQAVVASWMMRKHAQRPCMRCVQVFET
jgi:hypothetical protein